jgi:hypothetical protein
MRFGVLGANTVILTWCQHIWNRQPSERTFFYVAHAELSMRAANTTADTRIDVVAEPANPHMTIAPGFWVKMRSGAGLTRAGSHLRETRVSMKI